MPYIEGFVAAVPTANKEKYIEQAREATTYFKSLGATRIVECWGDDVPKGEVTDFYRAVQAKEDETVTFSWIEYPDKATRDAANERMAADSDTDIEMPFDSKRMFWEGSSRWSANRRADRLHDSSFRREAIRRRRGRYVTAPDELQAWRAIGGAGSSAPRELRRPWRPDP